jgi:hypothetical protein
MIRIEAFLNAKPAQSPRMAARSNSASWAENCDVRSGCLEGIRQPRPVAAVSGGPFSKAVRIRKRSTDELLWVGLSSPYAELVQSPVLNDAFDRVYLFAPNEPPKVSTFDRLKDGLGFSLLAVSGPQHEPIATVEGTPTNTSIFLKETRAYIFTYITSWGEESAPSLPVTVDVLPGQRVRLTNLMPPSPPALDGRSWQSVRLYRTVVALSTVEFYTVEDVPWGTDEFVDDRATSRVVLNRVFDSSNDPLPDGFWGTRSHPSGSLVAFKGNTVRFSVPYLPHAWPDEWRWGFPDEIVAVEVYGQNVFVMTESGFHTMFGARAPELGIVAYPYPMPCLSYGSVVNTPQGVFFMTQHGLAVASGGPPKDFTKGLISSDQWRRAFAREAFSCYDDGYYTAIFDDGTGFRIDLEQGTGLSTLSYDRLYLPHTDRYTGVTFGFADGVVHELNPPDGAPKTYMWQSGDYVLAKPMNLEALEVDFDELPPGLVDDPMCQQVRIMVWADGNQIVDQWTPRRVPMTLPAGREFAVWRVAVQGCAPLHSIAVAATVKGLARV